MSVNRTTVHSARFTTSDQSEKAEARFAPDTIRGWHVPAWCWGAVPCAIWMVLHFAKVIP